MDEEKIICRMDLKQCNETKCDKTIRDFIVYVQWNKETDDDYLLAGLKKVCSNIKNFCDWKYLISE